MVRTGDSNLKVNLNPGMGFMGLEFGDDLPLLYNTRINASISNSSEQNA